MILQLGAFVLHQIYSSTQKEGYISKVFNFEAMTNHFYSMVFTECPIIQSTPTLNDVCLKLDIHPGLN